MVGTQPSRKFTDEDLIIEYNQGLTDKIMAKRLNVSQTAVWSRRTKLGLITKNQITSSRILNKKELLTRYEVSNKRKSDKRDWKIKNRPGFKEEYREKVYKWNRENPEKIKIITKKGNDAFRLKHPHYDEKYKIFNCIKCGKSILKKNSMCLPCSNNSRKKWNYCIDCNKEIAQRSIRCKSCNNKHRWKVFKNL